jgi:hypothetical protein
LHEGIPWQTRLARRPGRRTRCRLCTSGHGTTHCDLLRGVMSRPSSRYRSGAAQDRLEPQGKCGQADSRSTGRQGRNVPCAYRDMSRMAPSHYLSVVSDSFGMKFTGVIGYTMRRVVHVLCLIGWGNRGSRRFELSLDPRAPCGPCRLQAGKSAALPCSPHRVLMLRAACESVKSAWKTRRIWGMMSATPQPELPRHQVSWQGHVRLYGPGGRDGRSLQEGCRRSGEASLRPTSAWR